MSVFIKGESVYAALQGYRSILLGNAADDIRIYPKGAKYAVLPLCEVFTDAFGRTNGLSSLTEWEAVNGRWNISSVPDPFYSVSPYYLTGEGRSSSLFLAGLKGNRSYLFKAAVSTTDNPCEIGVATACFGGESLVAYWKPLFEWYGELRVAVLPAGEILFTRPMRMRPKQWYEFSLALSNGRYFFSLDSFPIASGESPRNSGKAGLYVAGGRAFFDDVVLVPIGDAEPESEYKTGWSTLLAFDRRRNSQVPSVFLSDTSMNPWASDLLSWEYRGYGTKRVMNYKRMLRRDVILSMKVVNRNSIPRRMSLFTQGSGKGGVTFIISGSTNLRVSVKCDSNTFGEVKIPLKGTSFPFKFEIGLAPCGDGEHSAFVIINGRRHIVGRAKLKQAKGGIDVHSNIRSFNEFDVFSSSQRDYTFSTAPVDFSRRAGEWIISSRWACSPQYSWLGGKSNPSAALTSKFDICGDYEITVYAAPLMEGYMRPGYRNPGRCFIEAQGDGTPLSGHVFSIFNNGKDELFAAGENRRASFRPRTPSSPFWFHNMWLSMSLRKRGGKLSARSWNQRTLSIDVEPRESGPLALWFSGNDFTIARLSVTADSFKVRKPIGLDAEPPTPLAVELSGKSNHPLLSAPAKWVAFQPAEMNIHWEKKDGISFLVAKAGDWNGGFNLLVPTKPVEVRSNPVWVFAYDIPSGDDFILKFSRGDDTYFLPLSDSAHRPLYCGGLAVPRGFYKRSAVVYPNGESVKVLVFYARVFADYVLFDSNAVFAGLKFTLETDANGKRLDFCSSASTLKLYAVDFIASKQPAGVPLPQGWSVLKTSGQLPFGFALAATKDTRTAFTVKHLQPEASVNADYRNSSILFTAKSPFGILPSTLNVKAAHSQDNCDKDAVKWTFDGCTAVARIRVDGYADSSTKELSFSAAAVDCNDNKVDFGDNEFETARFLQEDNAPPVFSIKLPTPALEDNEALPWLESYGGKHALFPMPIRGEDGWEYVVKKNVLGGFCGLSIRKEFIDSNLYPYLTGKFSTEYQWELDVHQTGGYRSFNKYSARATPVITGPRGRPNAAPERPFSMKVAIFGDKPMLVEKLFWGDHFFTSGQENWWLRIKNLALVPRIYRREFSFEVSGSDIGDIKSIEYALQYPRSINEVGPRNFPNNFKTADGPVVRIAPEKKGLVRLAVRTVDGMGNRSAPRWVLFECQGLLPKLPGLRKWSLSGGSPKWERSITLMLQNISPDNVVVHIGSRTASVTDRTVRYLDGNWSRGGQYYSRYSVPLLASDTGHLKVKVTGFGYDGSQMNNSFTIERDPLKASSPPGIKSLVLQPQKRLAFDDYENGVGEAEGRRGAFVVSTRAKNYRGNSSLCIQAFSDNDYFSAFLSKRTYSLREYPFVDFDYFGGNSRMTLMVKVNGSFYDVQVGRSAVQMSRTYGQQGRFRIAGSLGYSSGIIGKLLTGDDLRRWNHVHLDLYKALAKVLPLRDGDIRIDGIALRAGGYNGIGTKIYVDNFAAWAPDKGITLSWEPEDFIPCKGFNARITRLGDGRTHSIGGGRVSLKQLFAATNGKPVVPLSMNRSIRISDIPSGSYLFTIEAVGINGTSRERSITFEGK